MFIFTPPKNRQFLGLLNITKKTTMGLFVCLCYTLKFKLNKTALNVIYN